MVRLIATDIDGTLVNGPDAPLPEGFLDMVKYFMSKGVIVVAASGRQYYTLKAMFGDAAEDMAYIAENGSVVIYRDEVLYSAAMDRDKCMILANETQAIEGVEVLISTKEHFITKIKTEQYRQQLEALKGMRNKEVDDFEETDGDILKVAIYSKDGISDELAGKLYEEWHEDFECVRSQSTWYDFMAHNANKGIGMQKLLEHFDIDPQDVYAFGDNYNDLQMLQYVGHGYIKSQSADALKALVKYETDDVMKVLRDLKSQMEG